MHVLPPFQWRASPWLIGLLISLSVCLVLLLVRNHGGLVHLEMGVYDRLVRLQSDRLAGDDRVVLVAITEEDIQESGHWPISDATLAEALAGIAAGRPRALGVDLYRDVPVPPGYDTLQNVIQNMPFAVFITKYSDHLPERVPPPAVLKGSKQSGFADMVVDADGIVRRAALFLDDGHEVFYSFALRLALLYLEADGIVPRPDPINPSHLALGGATLIPFEADDGGYVQADSRGYQILIDYGVAPAGFVTYRLADVLTKQTAAQHFTDRIVLLGVSAETVKDYFYTPLRHDPAAGQRMDGITLNAQIVSYLLRLALNQSRPVRYLSNRLEAIWIYVWVLLGVAVGYGGRSLQRFMSLAMTGIALMGWLVWLAFSHRWWIAGVPPLIGFIVSAGLMNAFMVSLEKHRWAILRRLFGQYVSEEVAQTVWQAREQLVRDGHLHPRRLTATVLFADLAGFGRIASGMAPADLINWLNVIMGRLTAQVIGHQGLVNKYMGDAVMAVFGAPLPRTSEAECDRDAVNAVACALAIQRELAVLNHQRHAAAEALAAMRIGIFTGNMVAGSLGGRNRVEYTVIGEAVNAASRLESFADQDFKPDFFHTPCRILVGEETCRRLKGRFPVRRYARTRLKGMPQQVVIYEILAEYDSADLNKC